MSALNSLLALQSSLPAETPAATSTISVQTAILILLTIAVALMAKSLIALRARVEQLEQRNTPATPAAASLASEPPKSATVAAPLPAATATTADPEAISIDIFAVIAAALHVTLDGRARIVAITPDGGDRVWSLEGRRQIFHSHQVR